MATYIETAEARETGNTVPSASGNIIRKEQWGIDSTLPGLIVTGASMTHSAMTDDTLDQKGAVVSQLDYDHQYGLTLDVIGGSAEDGTLSAGNATYSVGDTSFSWGDATWKITGITYTGSFQDKKRYQINCVRFTNFPA